jgi:hypothetical protein
VAVVALFHDSIFLQAMEPPPKSGRFRQPSRAASVAIERLAIQAVAIERLVIQGRLAMEALAIRGAPCRPGATAPAGGTDIQGRQWAPTTAAADGQAPV